jgi:hypothetical protein
MSTRHCGFKSFSAQSRALCVTASWRRQAEDRRRARQASVVAPRLQLQAIGCEGSPTRGLVAPVDYHREEKE